MEDFISISGTKMRALARQQATPCPDVVPTDLLGENCVPNGFMVPKGWDIVTDYYSHIDTKEWVPWSRPIVAPEHDSKKTRATGTWGTGGFSLRMKNSDDSFWHSIPPYSDKDAGVVNMVTEIPLHVTAKMEVDKNAPGNAIRQDINDDGSPRYYTYGVPFFNYGLIPQTWEDPSIKSEDGHYGDDDPLDVVDASGVRLEMGSVTPCRVLGSVELIDSGETDHKVVCIAEAADDYSKIKSLADLEVYRPDFIEDLVHWMKSYKTSDGKGLNVVANGEEPIGKEEALAVIEETHGYWSRLCEGKDEDDRGYDLSGCP